MIYNGSQGDLRSPTNTSGTSGRQVDSALLLRCMAAGHQAALHCTNRQAIMHLLFVRRKHPFLSTGERTDTEINFSRSSECGLRPYKTGRH